MCDGYCNLRVARLYHFLNMSTSFQKLRKDRRVRKQMKQKTKRIDEGVRPYITTTPIVPHPGQIRRSRHSSVLSYCLTRLHECNETATGTGTTSVLAHMVALHGEHLVAGYVALSVFKKVAVYGAARWYGFPKIYRKLMRMNRAANPEPAAQARVRDSVQVRSCCAMEAVRWALT